MLKKSAEGFDQQGRMARVVVASLLVLELVTILMWGVKADWYETVVENAGIASMHTAVTHTGAVILLDRTNIGDSQLPLPNGVCRDNPADRVRSISYPGGSLVQIPLSSESQFRLRMLLLSAYLSMPTRAAKFEYSCFVSNQCQS